MTVVVAGYSEFQMDRDLRIFNRHFAHSTRSTLCTRYRLDNRTALSRHRHLHYGIRFRMYWITSRIAILRKEKRIGARLHFFFLHLLTDCDLRVDAKNDIFTWTFVKKKKKIKKEKKIARTEERTDCEVKPGERIKVYCMDAISIHFH